MVYLYDDKYYLGTWHVCWEWEYESSKSIGDGTNMWRLHSRETQRFEREASGQSNSQGCFPTGLKTFTFINHGEFKFGWNFFKSDLAIWKL